MCAKLQNFQHVLAGNARKVHFRSKTFIFAAEGSHRDDLPSLLDAARKAVAHGNKVYILPNPKGIRTADFIFENKGILGTTSK
jgi:hypothetical protein